MKDMHEVDASVLVPVLNEEEHIREAVDAMRAQDFDGTIEFLFMDGGSTDGTRGRLEELAAEDPRIRVLDNPERTTAYALNVGLAAARGSYVARMDAHAFYPPRYIAAGVERLERGDVVWVAGPAIPRGEGRWSRRVALALNSGLTTIGSRKWRARRRRRVAAARGRARHGRVRGRVAALDARGARRLGPRVADQPGLGAGRARCSQRAGGS